MEATSEVLDGVEDRVESLRKAAKRLLADKVTRRAFLSGRFEVHIQGKLT